jgi:hypothetical protein
MDQAKTIEGEFVRFVEFEGRVPDRAADVEQTIRGFLERERGDLENIAESYGATVTPAAPGGTVTIEPFYAQYAGLGPKPEKFDLLTRELTPLLGGPVTIVVLPQR